MYCRRSNPPIGNKTYKNCIYVKHTTFVTSQCQTSDKNRNLQITPIKKITAQSGRFIGGKSCAGLQMP